MKIYQKKNVSVEDQTVLVQLERRHTLKDANEVDLDDNLRKTTRANSLGSFEKGNASTDIEAVIDKKQNKCTRKPTVITESELSSSWLYKDRKAKINSDDENIEDPKSSNPSENYEDFEPRTLENPNLKPVPVSNQRPRKKSSCCWYFAIILAICIACAVLMAGIGGIVFMEYFATYELADTDKLVKNENPSASKDISQHSSHEQNNLHRNEPEIPANILNDFIKNPTLFLQDTNVSRKEIAPSQPEENISHRQKLSNPKDSKTEELKDTKNSFVYEDQDVVMAEHSKATEFSDMSRYIIDQINNFKVPTSDKFVKIKTNTGNQNPSDFKFNYQSGNRNMNQIPDRHVDKSNKQVVENESIPQEISNLESEVSKSSEDFLHERNFEMTSLKGFESKIEQVISNISFQSRPKQNSTEHSAHISSSVNFLGHMNNAIDNSNEDNLFDHKDSIDYDPKDSLSYTEFPIDNKEKNEFFDPLDHSFINNSSNHEQLIEHSSKDNSLNHEQLMEHSSKDTSLNHEQLIEHSSKDNSLNHEQLMEHSSKDNSLNHEQLMELSSKDTSLNHEQLIEHSSKDTSLNHEQLIEHSSKDNSLEHIDHSINQSSQGNSLEHIDHSLKNNSLEDIEHSIENNTFLKDHNEDSREFDSDNSSFEEHSLSDEEIKNFNDSAQLVFIRPVVESKAVPVPLAFLKRIGFDIKNPDSHQAISANDMDIKFSLAEALKYLRSLDADNKLPDSREKTIGKIINQKEKKKKLPLITEREEYLNNLRKQIFEDNL